MITRRDAAAELLRRRAARNNLAAYINYTNPKNDDGFFFSTVCAAIDKFILDVQAGNRPILILQAPPQHGKSEIVSRRLPPYLISRFPNWRIGAASYGQSLAIEMARYVRMNLAEDRHKRLFPVPSTKRKFDRDTVTNFTSPDGEGSYVGVGIGSGLTGRPLDIGIIDDPTKDQEDALSQVIKESVWSWYQAVFSSRLSEYSGQIVMATSWAEDDLPGRIMATFSGDPRLTVLKFPAINLPGEVGYNPNLPEGALAEKRRSLNYLYQLKKLNSDYWWSAVYQQSPKALGGNVFKEEGLRYYYPKDLPKKFDKIIASWDCTFKDTDGTDFVVGQVWGKKDANSYLLDQVRARMSFTKTVSNVVELREKHPRIREILIEDKANGPAVIDTLKATVSGIIPIEPDGSKLARAHAVTSYWEAGNVWLPHPDTSPWVKDLVSELTAFPAAANDDQVDALTQALRRLYPLFNKLKISQNLLDKVAGR